MNDNARKVVAALRSGEYTQGVGHLREDDNYCCLGVACDIFHKETGQGQWVANDPWSELWRFRINDGAHTTVLPITVQEWLGFNNQSGGFDDDSLIDRNDSGHDFLQIADLIESEPKGLFK